MITAMRLKKSLFLGNFLFVYAGVKGIANYKGYDFKVPWQAVDKLKYFKASPEVISDEVLSVGYKHFRMKHNYCFDPEFFNTVDNVDLSGYFGSEKYFEHCIDEIREDLQLNDDIVERNMARLNEVRLDVDHLVAIHVRRGDYVKTGFANLGDNTNYYHNAIDYFNETLEGKIAYVVVSNDVEWTKDYFAPRDERFIFASQEDNNLDREMVIDDFAIMACCDHNIIANSTFSWWGAWMGESLNPDRIVVRPTHWKKRDTGEEQHISDIFPARWVVISSYPYSR